MSIKSILCIFNGTPDEISCLNTALALAKSCVAQLRIIHITPPITASMEGIIANGIILDDMERDNEERLTKAKDYCIHYTTLNHVPLDVAEASQHQASAKFIHLTDTIENVVSHEGRMSDLLIVGRSANKTNIVYDSSLMTALFDTGRPVLIAPQIQGALPREWERKIIAISWNGSLEAARAIYNAMPFLEKAEKVSLLIARDHREIGLVTDETSVTDYLRAHGVAGDIIMIDHDALSTGEALLAKAHELNADLMVLGAYGHTRFREMILGGVTNYMLEKSNIPVLLSH